MLRNSARGRGHGRGHSGRGGCHNGRSNVVGRIQPNFPRFEWRKSSLPFEKKYRETTNEEKIAYYNYYSVYLTHRLSLFTIGLDEENAWLEYLAAVQKADLKHPAKLRKDKAAAMKPPSVAAKSGRTTETSSGLETQDCKTKEAVTVLLLHDDDNEFLSDVIAAKACTSIVNKASLKNADSPEVINIAYSESENDRKPAAIPSAAIPSVVHSNNVGNANEETAANELEGEEEKIGNLPSTPPILSHPTIGKVA
jgi:hypothetical protein